MANFRENGQLFRQNDVFWEVRGSAKLTERSAEPVRSISAEPFGFGRTLTNGETSLCQPLMH